MKFLVLLATLFLIGCSKDLVVGPGSGPGIIKKDFLTSFASGTLEGKHSGSETVTVSVEYTALAKSVAVIKIHTDLETFSKQVFLDKGENIVFTVSYTVEGNLTDIEIY